MKERIKDIMRSKDPCGQDIENLDNRMGDSIRTIGILSTIFSFIIALIIALLFSKAYEDSYNTDVTLFGIHFWIDNDSFFMSPFMVFCYVSIILEVAFYLIGLVISALIVSIQANTAKKNLLHNTYRTAQLLELIASTMKDNNGQTQPNDPAPQSPEANELRVNMQKSLNPNTQNVHQTNPAADTSGQIICPKCQASQYYGRGVCYRCGHEFKSDHKPDAKPNPVPKSPDRMFCPSCGLEQSRNRLVCFKCGRQFKSQ